MQLLITKKHKIGVCLLAALAIFFISTVTAFPKEAKFKNVIIMVADGMGVTHITISRWYKGKALAIDKMSLGAVRTYNSESLITDSASAATAFACGFKTNNYFLGILPKTTSIPGIAKINESMYLRPIANVLEGAKLTGRSVGIVATANIQHATPAAFSSHWHDRKDYDEIAKQQVYLSMDVVLGGGKKYLLPKGKGGDRNNGEDLLEVIKSKGYKIVETKDAMRHIKTGRLWGVFANDDMAYELDRRVFFPEQPTLAEMTQKAIELLSKNPKGFFLFVEGSKIDWASHANDPVGVISDVLAFDDAVKTALEFSKKNRNTLVLVFSDHGNGGMSIGNSTTDSTYSRLSYEAVFNPLKKARLTGEGVEIAISKNLSEENIRKTVGEYYGVDDLTGDEIKSIRDSKPKRMNNALGAIMSKRAKIGWTTHGHTGEDLFLYVYGLKKSLSVMENTDIARLAANAMSFELSDITRSLFVEAQEAFRAIGAKTKIENSNDADPKLIVEMDGKYAELPFSKDLIKIGKEKKEHRIQGINIFSALTKKVFIPQDAVSIFLKSN